MSRNNQTTIMKCSTKNCPQDAEKDKLLCQDCEEELKALTEQDNNSFQELTAFDWPTFWIGFVCASLIAGGLGIWLSH